MKITPTTPYLLRAIYEWCVDNGFTPYVAVRVNERTKVPVEYVRNGEIVLNVSADATRNLTLGNEVIQFSARFNGVSRELSVPVDCVAGIFAKENGQGLAFPATEPPSDAGETDEPESPDDSGPDDRDPPPSGGGRPKLQIVK
ncbi:MAG: ClpXP protease specificity-enhancing factor [Betaproteobacteria bacterium]|nr:ClpXP protease specificity-enhancing factor [Betaproteobacteria bacterium]